MNLHWNWNTVSKSIVLSLIFALLFPLLSYGRASQDYASNSVLATGKWIKIAITQRGIHQISEEQLIEWGFPEPSKVKLFGYGGTVIGELFSNQDNYIDDLPQIPLYRANGNIYFYAQGTTQWTFNEANQEFTHRLHPYATHSYFFLTDTEGEQMEIPVATSATAENTPIEKFNDYFLHEQELVSVGKTGQNFFGEDFLNQPQQAFQFSLPGIQPETAKLRVAFGAKTDTEGKIYISYNGSEYPYESSTDHISQYLDDYEFLKQISPLKVIDSPTEESTISVRYEGSGETIVAHLDYIRINYTRQLQLYDGQVNFRFIERNSGDSYIIHQAPATTIVWDVTIPHAPKSLTVTPLDQAITFAPEDLLLHEYVAFDPYHTFPTPQFVKQVENQNLHALEIPNLTIITPTALISEAERVATLHREEGLTVEVIDQEKIFNEFSSGTPDASAYRRLMKMFYDRAPQSSKRPKYLLLFGDGSYDNRKAMEKLHTSQCNLLLTYQSKTSIDERESFVIEDYFGFLEDRSGENVKVNKVCLGIGRFPVSTIETAKKAVNKLYSYVHSTDFSPWKNNLIFAADDGDNTIHAQQTSLGCDTLLRVHSAPRWGFHPHKIFVESYYKDPNGKCPGAHDNLMQQFTEGALLFNYIGHNDHNTWGFTSEGLLSRFEMTALTNKRLSLWVTVTCDFCRFDQGNEPSAGEEVFLLPHSGAIALVTTTRVVYTDGNEKINKRFLKHLFDRESNGTRMRLGDVLRLAKRDFGSEIDKNKLNYVLIGDPAMTLDFPEHSIEVSRINEAIPDSVELKIGEPCIVEGEVRTYKGLSLPNFNGYIHYSLYDQAEEKTLNYQDNSGKNQTFIYTHRPHQITSGRDTVINGKFKIKVILPPENSHSGKSAMLNLYAFSSNGEEANGYTNQLIISTSTDTINLDYEGPVIGETWVSDQWGESRTVCSNPATFNCKVSDPSGFWNGNTLGKQMTLLLNGISTETNINRYFYTSTQEGLTLGELRYPLPPLSNGWHTITFKLFDSLGNSSETTHPFEVNNESRQYELQIEEEPAIEKATITCVDEEGIAITGIKQIRLSITDATGKEIWHKEGNDENIFPLVWNLQNQAGERVPAGQYNCQGYFDTPLGRTVTPAKKIVVIMQ